MPYEYCYVVPSLCPRSYVLSTLLLNVRWPVYCLVARAMAALNIRRGWAEYLVPWCTDNTMAMAVVHWTDIGWRKEDLVLMLNIPPYRVELTYSLLVCPSTNSTVR